MNSNTISFIALTLSLVFSGAFIGGEIHRQRAIKAELKLIESERQKAMLEVANINERYALQKQIFLQETAGLYAELDSILSLKTLNSKKIQEAQAHIDRRREKIELETASFEKLAGMKIDEYLIPVNSLTSSN
jgi:hypothetical protein